MFYKILGGKLIQLSDKKLPGFEEVIEDKKLNEKDGFYIVYNYIIKDNEVHKIFEYQEIRETEDLK